MRIGFLRFKDSSSWLLLDRALTRKSLLISLLLPHVRVLRLERGSLVGGRLPHVHVRCPVLVFPVETRLASQGGVLVVGAVIGARLSPVTAVTRDRRVRWRLALVRHLKRLIWSVDFHGDWFWSLSSKGSRLLCLFHVLGLLFTRLTLAFLRLHGVIENLFLAKFGSTSRLNVRGGTGL